MDPVFDPEGIVWQRVSPKLINVRVVTWTLSMLVPLLGCVAWVVLQPAWWSVLCAAVFFAVYVWVLIVISRQVRAIGYAEREEDLLIRKGVLFKSLTVVPYGRMQLVDVEAGPLDRKFNLAKVTLNTASAQSDAVVPGLLPDEAARLRDRLASRGEARLAGL